MQKVISITEAKRKFPDFEEEWLVNHLGCRDPGSVVISNRIHATVRHVVVVETDEKGNPIKPLYDKMQVEEGRPDQEYPGSIVIPWFIKFSNNTHVVLRRKQRPVRGTNAWEFPQGYAESGEDAIVTGAREMLEETGLTHVSIERLGDICPEPDWFTKAPAVIAAQVNPLETTEGEDIGSFPLNNLSWTVQVDSGTTLAALLRFMAWHRSK